MDIHPVVAVGVVQSENAKRAQIAADASIARNTEGRAAFADKALF
jgi:hypothetical protein